MRLYSIRCSRFVLNTFLLKTIRRSENYDQLSQQTEWE